MKKTYIAILSLMALAACQEPVNYLEQAQAFFEADETMELTASAMGMSESTEVELCVIEVGGSWYIDAMSGGLDF